jgi:MFS family permease
MPESSPQNGPSPIRNIYAFGITSFLNDTATEMAYWVLPAFLVSLGAGPAQLGLIEGIAESVASFAKLFSGYLTDRLERRKPLVVAGYFVEYSAMAFALFYLGEYGSMILMSAMTAILFLGGWLAPFNIEPFTGLGAHIWGGFWFALKVAFLLFCFLWVRATMPRFRYDQLMRLGWKVFLPLSLFWLVLTAGVLVGMGWLPT